MKKIIAVILVVFISFYLWDQITSRPIQVQRHASNRQIEEQLKDPVIYSVESKIYHEPNCKWAHKCTEIQYYTERSEAKKIGKPCKVCH